MKREKLKPKGIILSLILVPFYWSAHNAQGYKHSPIQSYKDLRKGYN